jgi:hypothetical protein
VIREDRELLVQLARLGRDMVPLAMRIMEGSASASEQQDYARRLIAAGERLRQRAGEPVRVVIDGEALTNEAWECTAEPYQDP